jgi:tRNA (adenine37-N6)-methyltransferase
MRRLCVIMAQDDLAVYHERTPMPALELMPIGTIHNSVTDPIDEQWNKVISDIHINPDLADGLKGLEDWSHIVVIYVMHQTEFNKAEHLVRRPRGISEMPEIGIFAQRARHRPNLIGITAVKIQRIEGNIIRVKGLDAIDGTPVIDIKPYAPVYDGVSNPLVPSWFLQMMQGYF